MRQQQPGPRQHRPGAAVPAAPPTDLPTDLPADLPADLPTVQIRSGFLAGLRRRPVRTLTVRAADGALLARERTASYLEAVGIARDVCRAARIARGGIDLAV